MKKIYSIFAVLTLMIASPIVTGQSFSIQGSKILAPNGTEFIPIGANVNGFNFQGWEKNVINNTNNSYTAIVTSWKFNCLRANIYMYAPTWNGSTTDVAFKGNETAGFAALDAIINRYTPAGVVVQIEIHDFTGTLPNTSQLVDLKSIWNKIATRYKNNTYVWFNIMNEPVWTQPCPIGYRDAHQAVIAEIRDVVGANNIIIVDGAQYGQEAYSWDNNPIVSSNSGILTYGYQLLNFNNKIYSNIMFSIHLYDQWAFGNTALTAKFGDYITRIKNAGFALMVGEVGSTGPGDNDRIKSTEVAYWGLKNHKLGMLAWHWEPGDGFRLVDGSNVYRGDQINSASNPTNSSSWEGYYFWQATHIDGFGLGSGTSINVTGVTLSSASASVSVGATITLTATVAPNNATNKTVLWNSNNTSIATVNSGGIVTGISIGSATITATTQDGSKTASCAITVTSAGSGTNLIQNPGFESGIANWTVSGGTASAVTNNMQGGANAIQVGPAQWSWVQTSNLTGWTAGASYTLSAWAKVATAGGQAAIGIKGDAGVIKEFSYTSTSYTQQSSDIIIPAGTTWLQIYITNPVTGIIYADDISLIKLVPVTGVSVNPTSANITVGTNSTLTATVAPADASNKSVNWTSSNKAIAIVSSSGVITGVAAGSATITATTVDGSKTATCTVTVSIATNLIQNPGFESNLTNWTLSGGSASVIASNKHSGSKALSIGTAAWSWVQTSSLTGWASGSSYTFSVWGKVGTLGNQVVVGIKGSAGVIKELTFTSTTYVQQTASITIPAGTTWLQVYITIPVIGAGFVDDLSLTSITKSAIAFSVSGINMNTNNAKKNFDLNVYPNPVTNNGLSINLPNDEATITIYNLQGKIVYKSESKGQPLLYVESSDIGKSGIYIVCVQTLNMVNSKKIVIQ